MGSRTHASGIGLGVTGSEKAYLTGVSVDWENQQVEVTLCANYLAERIRVYS